MNANTRHKAPWPWQSRSPRPTINWRHHIVWYALLLIGTSGHGQSLIILAHDTIHWWPPEDTLLLNTSSSDPGEIVIGTRTGSRTTYRVAGGSIVALTVLNDQGIKTEEAFYKEGKLHGPWTRWRDDGTLQESGHYEYGLESGEWIFYRRNGKRQLSGSFLADPEHQLKDFLIHDHLLEEDTGDHMIIVSMSPQHSPPHGQWLFYDVNGKVAGIIDFEKGMVKGLHMGDVE